MADTDWNLHSKQLITPVDEDRMLLEPSDETAKAVEVGGFRTWLMNTALFNTLTTTAKNIIGAIEEVKGIADNNTTQLNAMTNNKIDKSKIANNTLTTEEGFVLDARQGKVILDIIDSLNDIGTFTIISTADTPIEYTINFNKTLRNIPNLNLTMISNSISNYDYSFSIKDITTTQAIISIRCNTTLSGVMFKYSATCM